MRDVISDEQRETVVREEVIASFWSIVDDCDEIYVVRSQLACAETHGAGVDVLCDSFAGKATATLKLRQRSILDCSLASDCVYIETSTKVAKTIKARVFRDREMVRVGIARGLSGLRWADVWLKRSATTGLNMFRLSKRPTTFWLANGLLGQEIYVLLTRDLKTLLASLCPTPLAPTAARDELAAPLLELGPRDEGVVSSSSSSDDSDGTTQSSEGVEVDDRRSGVDNVSELTCAVIKIELCFICDPWRTYGMEDTSTCCCRPRSFRYYEVGDVTV
eukprot:1226506-Amphidinium_carterae.1